LKDHAPLFFIPEGTLRGFFLVFFGGENGELISALGTAAMRRTNDRNSSVTTGSDSDFSITPL
jgi:hypothetical protein